MDNSLDAQESPSTPGTLPRGTETILLVDDDESLRQVTRRILRRLGYKVIEASTPESALRIVKMSGIDLLLVDVILPMMSGLTLAEAIRVIRPTARVLYMSGYTNQEVLSEVANGGRDQGFIEKPFTAAELASEVRELLDTVSDRPIPPPIPGGSETLLVVEDDGDVRRNIVRMLERLGYRVLQAQDPDHALRITLQSHVDLILMDMILPRMDGGSLANTISSLRPRTGVVFMSGYSAEELAARGVDLPGATFLEKPFTPDEMGRTVRQVLDQGPASPDAHQGTG